jgi:hypothetical protein
MAFVNHPMEEEEKPLRDYASPRLEDINVQIRFDTQGYRVQDQASNDQYCGNKPI